MIKIKDLRMQIRQIKASNVFEGLQPGEYYVWTVHFEDGTSTPVKIKWDETSKESLEKHFGKPIVKIDHDFGIQGGHSGHDPVVTKDYHDQQDRAEKNTPKDVWNMPQRFEESLLNEISKELRDKYVNRAVSAHGGYNMARRNTQGDEQKEWQRKENNTNRGISRALSDERRKKDSTNEAGLGGINREPSPVNVSYDEVLNDVTDKWKGQSVSVKEAPELKVGSPVSHPLIGIGKISSIFGHKAVVIGKNGKQYSVLVSSLNKAA